MRFAYADPPYIGQARIHYGPDAREVNHELLIGWLERDFDAWALSLSAPSLQKILPLCPEGVRVCAWVKGWCSWKPGNRVVYAWEPVIFRGVRGKEKGDTTVRDWVNCNITTNRTVRGAKPDGFCSWLFDVAGLRPEDDFCDVFPGSGAVTRAWEKWRQQPCLAAPLFQNVSDA